MTQPSNISSCTEYSTYIILRYFCELPFRTAGQQSESIHGLNEETTAVVYEEIGDVKSSFRYTQNVLYGFSANPPTFSPVHESCPASESYAQHYELIETSEYQTINDPYKVQKCSAYGIVSTEGSSDFDHPDNPRQNPGSISADESHESY